MHIGIFQFLRDRRGAAAAEFALISLIFAGMLIAILDVGRAFYEYNRAYKACQVGVRHAIVNDLASVTMATFDGVAAGFAAGASIPANQGPAPVTCSGANGSASCAGGGGVDQAAFDRIFDKMAAHYPALANDPNAQLDITYEHIGMGFAGNPFGPDIWPLTTVEISGLQFNFATPLINTVGPIDFPKCSATLTGEDFTTCSGGGQPPC